MEVKRVDRWSHEYTIRFGCWSASVVVADELMDSDCFDDMWHFIHVALLEAIYDKVFTTGYT
jgi:hypothetical protein